MENNQTEFLDTVVKVEMIHNYSHNLLCLRMNRVLIVIYFKYINFCEIQTNTISLTFLNYMTIHSL